MTGVMVAAALRSRRHADRTQHHGLAIFGVSASTGLERIINLVCHIITKG